MRRIALTLGVVTLLTSARPTRGATDILIDLATASAGTTEIPISTGTYTITIKNLAPHYFVAGSANPYQITIAKEEHAIPPLPLPSTDTPAKAASATPPSNPFADTVRAPDPCANDQPTLDAFTKQTSTSTATALLAKLSPACAAVHRPELCTKLRDELKGAEDEPGAANIVAQNDAIATACHDTIGTLLDGMTLPEGTYKLKENQSLVVTITRGADKTLRTWKYTYNAPASTTFRVSYGFNFIPNRDQDYYAKTNTPTAGSTTTTYTLTEKAQTKSLDFAPSVFFTYPFDINVRPLEIGLSAGLGFDFSAPIVFFGPGIIINQNIQVLGGVVIHQEQRLRGEYATGQSLTENLTSDQVTQKTYRPNAFVGITFQFDNNPFANNTTPAKVATPTPAPTPKATPDTTKSADTKPADTKPADTKPKSGTEGAEKPAPTPSPAPAPTPAPANK